MWSLILFPLSRALSPNSGLEIATDMVANATNIFSLVVVKFQDKFASLQQLDSPNNSRDTFQICCIDMYLMKISSEFCGILHVFVNFAGFRRFT